MAPEAPELDVPTHGWLEVFVPGHGWWALDPTNAQRVGELHAKFGHGRDYQDVMPLRGVYHGGSELRPRGPSADLEGTAPQMTDQ